MQVFPYPDKSNWPQLLQRPTINNTLLQKQVGKIIEDVRKGGDSALKRFAKKFDQISIRNLQVTEKEILQASRLLSDELKDAIASAEKNIRKFHLAQKEESKHVETSAGVTCWRKSLPITRVGLYIPGGTAPLFSTILMLGIPASIAGCKEIVLCTPPSKDGTIHPAILFTASMVGITEIYKCGGAQAIAAMAYGTSSISKVDKIFGPGNQYVTAAKQMVQMEGVAIDMPAGPSEVCVYADATAEPDYVAADLLSQAEHGADSQVLLVATEMTIIEKVLKALEKQVGTLSRSDIANKSLENSRAILVNNTDEAMELINQYAPEHFIIASNSYSDLVEKVENAGSVFLGNYTPESAGDYASGTNHTLPTNGYAKAYSGVSLDSFVKKVTFQHISASGIQLLGKTIITMAEAEGLDAHAHAVRVRLNNIKN
jgi:histidinol dehydrogenase